MSEKDDWTASPSDFAEPPPKKKGMSGCMIALLVACGLGFVTAMVCVGVSVWLFMTFVPKVSKEPAEVLATTQKILQIEVPKDFAPDTSMNMDKNSFIIFRMATFQNGQDQGALILASMLPKIQDNNPNGPNDQSRQFREPFEKPIRERLDVKRSETHKITVDGNPADLMIGEGTDKQSNKPAHMASMAFKAGSAYITFLIWMDDEDWDEEGLIQMLENAKVPANP